MAIRVNFSGLITFVPKGDPKTFPPPEETVHQTPIRVLFVNGFEPHFGLPMVKNGKHDEVLHPHIPMVTFRLGDLSPQSSRQPDMTAGGYGACFVSYERFELGVGRPSKETETQPDGVRFQFRPMKLTAPPRTPEELKELTQASVSASASPPPCEPESRNSLDAGGTTVVTGARAAATAAAATAAAAAPGVSREDLCWLLPLHHAINQSGIELDGCLFPPWDSGGAFSVEPGAEAEPHPVGPGEALIAHTRLTSGRLYNRSFTHREIRAEHRVPFWNFAIGKGSAHHYQPLSSVVTWEPDREGGLVISSGIRGSEWTIPDLVFRDSASDNVELNFWNAPLHDLLNLLGGEGSHEFPSASGYSSFRSYFRLLSSHYDLPSMSPNKGAVARYQVYEDVPCKGVGCPCALAPAHPDA